MELTHVNEFVEGVKEGSVTVEESNSFGPVTSKQTYFIYTTKDTCVLLYLYYKGYLYLTQMMFCLLFVFTTMSPSVLLYQDFVSSSLISQHSFLKVSTRMFLR